MQTTMSQQEFFQANQNRPKGVSTADLISALQSRGVQIQGVSSFTPNATKQQAVSQGNVPLSPFEKVGSFLTGVGGGLGQVGTNIIGGAVGLVAPGAGAKIKAAGEQFAESGAIEPESKQYKAGQMVGKYGTIAALTAGAGELAAMAPGASSLIAQAATKSPVAGAMVKGAIAAAPEAAVYSEAARGELPTKEEVGFSAAANVLIPGFSAVLSKYAPDIFRIGANPKGKNYLDIEWKAGKATGKYAGTKRTIVEQANNVIKTAGKEMDELIEPITTQYTRKELADGARDMASQYTKSDPALADDILKYADEWEGTALLPDVPTVSKGKQADILENLTAKALRADAQPLEQILTAKDLRQMKTDLGELLSNVFSKDRTGDPKIAARLQALEGIWGKIDDALDAISPRVKELNQQMTVAYSLKAPLSKDLEKPAIQGVMQVLANPKSIPGITPVATISAGLAQKAAKILDAPGVPQSVKTAILELFNQD